jgi:hypothetical protein
MYKSKRVLIAILAGIIAIVTAYTGALAQHGATKKPVVKSKTETNKEHSLLNLPSWEELNNYQLSGLTFNKTTISEFNNKYPFIKLYEDPDETIRIYNYQPGKESYYSSIKLGFEEEKLSWIDYLPANKITIDQIIEVFGTPLAINSKVSKYLDYYDYGNLIISCDKKKGNIYTLTQYGKENVISNNAKDLGFSLPALLELKTGKVDKLIPGITDKASLKKIYPDLKPTSLSSQYYPDYVSEKPSGSYLPDIYYINRGLDDTYYKKVELVFQNDILSWIDIVPQKLMLVDALKIFGDEYKLDKSSPNINFYQYKNIILTVSPKTRSVLNIGLLGSVNSKLREILPPWQKLNREGIEGLKVDSTTEADFKKLLPGLVAQKQTNGNIDIYKVEEGLSSTNYEVIYFVFKNKKLNSVDVIPQKDLNISDVIKAYGNKYERDDKSSKDHIYYTFENVIVSFYKHNRVVSSIGLL